MKSLSSKDRLFLLGEIFNSYSRIFALRILDLGDIIYLTFIRRRAMNIIFVGIGGAVGSMLRYMISLLPHKSAFPILTLITNIIGAILIGYITGIAAKKNIPSQYVLLLKTGLCGGFTTFSTFSLEAYSLLQNGNYGYAILYALLSLIGCIIGVWGGVKLT
jgi:CrcB protein